MTQGKITKTEFKTWSKQLGALYQELLKIDSLFQDETEKKKYLDLSTLITFYTEKGNLWAISAALIGFGGGWMKRDYKLTSLGGLTLDEWDNKIAQRMREHCAANGYYNPNSPPNPTSLKERNKKVRKILADKEQLRGILVYADQEEYNTITSSVDFSNMLAEMGLSNDKDEDDPTKDAVLFQVLGFLYEDHFGRIEKLISKKEQAEKTDNPSSPTSNSPTSKPPIPTQYKDNLEAEIKRLQTQINELERKTNNAANSAEKENYQKILDSSKKDLGDKIKERDKLNNKQENPSKSNNSKVNLAIVLGIAAVLIGLICLILLINKRKER